MYPSSFEYFAPESLDEAFGILERFDGEAKVLAGGQSLIPVLKLRTFTAPAALVDINRIPDLDTLTVTRDGGLRIGALVRHKTCERSELLDGKFATLGDAAPQISDPIVRNLGTVCGSLAHADPQGDWGSALLAMGAELQARGPGGERTISLDDLFVAPFMTTLQPNEIVTEVRVPSPGRRAAGTYLKLERKVGDYATVAVAVHVSFADDDTVERAGIALTGVGPTNLRARRAEDALQGRALDDEAIGEAARLAAEEAQPFDDIRGHGRLQAEHGAGLHRARAAEGARPGRRLRVSQAAEVERRTTHPVTITVNGTPRSAEVEPRVLLVHFLRETLSLTGTHIGCDTTSCGACTVLVDGTPVKSCTYLAVQADGRAVTTVEGLGAPGALHALQEGFKEEHGLQCGFCTPGMMLTASALLAENPDPSAEEIRWALSGNICRCTGYQNIVKAVQWAARKQAEGGA